jgi:DNA-directed RNA polymerase subunit M/transcription elongation factor TFIIS
MVDLKCPKCGSDNTQRVNLEVFDKDVKSLWWLVVIFAVLGITINPIILSFVFVDIIVMIIANIKRKHNNRNNWVLQCSRCGHQFTIINPDKVDTINAQNKAKQEKQRQRIQAYAEKNKKTIDALNQNGKLEGDEILLNTVDYFTPRKYSYEPAWQLKVTDKTLVCFNAKRTFRVSKENIMYIKKKSYALIIPTGIQICIMENGKKKKCDFVVYTDKRGEIVDMLNKWKQSQQ